MNGHSLPAKVPQWFIAVVTPNTELSNQRKLKAWSAAADTPIETYVPTQRELHEWPSRRTKKWVDRVVCPCYLFIRCTPNVRYAIKAQCPYILHFVKDPARREDPTAISPFATISDAQMLDFRRMVGDADAPITIDTSTLRIGTKVRIKAGKLKGLTGYICRLPSSPAAVPAHPANAKAATANAKTPSAAAPAAASETSRSRFSLKIDFLGYATIDIDASLLEEES